MKVILLTSRKHIASCISVGAFLRHTLLKKHRIEVVGIVAADLFTSQTGPLGKLKKLSQKMGWNFTLRMVLTGFFQLVFLRLARLFIADKKRRYFEIEELAQRYGIPLLKVQNINDSQVLDFCRSQDPDYLVSSGLLQIVKAPLLNLPPRGALNFHPSLVQEHRGIFTSFWTLFRKKPTSGATVHFMTEKIDEGKVILQRRFFVHRSDSLYRIEKKSAELGGNMLVKALVKLKKKKENAIKIEKLARIFSIPEEKHIRIFQKSKKKVFRWEDIWSLLWK